jgi:hypothetical protein
MRATGWVSVAVFLMPGIAGLVRADEPAQVKAVIDKAVTALGGEEKLTKLKTAAWKGKGTLWALDLVLPFTEESWTHLPDQFRFEMEYDVNGSKVAQLLVVDGDKGWNKTGDDTTEMPDQYRDGLKDYLHAVSLALTPQVLRDKAYKVSPAGEIKIDERAAVGLRVSRKGRRDVNLYFDKETGLPIKAEMMAKELDGDPEIKFEFLFSDHKDFGGVRTCSKMTWKKDGKPYVERELTEVKPLAKLDDNILGKPGS